MIDSFLIKSTRFEKTGPIGNFFHSDRNSEKSKIKIPKKIDGRKAVRISGTSK